jgi:hypothetical protein
MMETEILHRAIRADPEAWAHWSKQARCKGPSTLGGMLSDAFCDAKPAETSIVTRVYTHVLGKVAWYILAELLIADEREERRSAREG